MPNAYCTCCRKMTAHKVVMRSSEQDLSKIALCARFVQAVFTGDHYMKMEQVSSCRVCNNEFNPALVSSATTTSANGLSHA